MSCVVSQEDELEPRDRHSYYSYRESSDKGRSHALLVQVSGQIGVIAVIDESS